jgi:negative regulator of flagellin synthesis FlgM
MEINNLNGLNPYGNQKVQQEATAKTAETARQYAAQKSANEGSDVVQFSSDGKLLASAMTSAKDAPDVRAEKVRELKEQVKNGTYKPDLQKAARNLIRDDLSQII